MTGDTEVDVPVVVDNKIEDVVKTDKEVIAEEEKEMLEKENEKTDEPEKTEEDKEEEVTEPKKLNLLQKLFGKRKDYVVPTIDEVAKTDKEVFIETEKTDEAEKTDEEKAEKSDNEKAEKTDEEKAEKTDEEKAEKTDEEKTEKTDEERKDEPVKVQSKLKKIFSMKKTKKEVTEKVEKPEGEEKIEEGDEEKKDQEKTDEENTIEVKEGEDAIEEVAEADISTTTAEKKTLMQKLMTIKRDLMANKKEDKVEEDKVEEDKKEEEAGGAEEKVEEKKEEAEKKEGEAEVKVDGEEPTEDDTKDELGNDKSKPNNRIKKFFSMKRDSKPILTKEAVEEAEKEDDAADGAENIEKTEKVNILQRLFGRKEKVEKDTEAKNDAESVETEKKEDTTEVKVEDLTEKIIMVHLVNRTPAIPSIDPMQLKLESWLKFHQIKYENTHNKDNLPASAYLPMQSNDYLAELANTHNKQMPMELDADQKNTQIAMMTLVEKNIHFAILSWQCSNVDNLLKGYKINLQTYLNSRVPLALLKLFFKNNFCKNGIKLVKTNGFADNNTEEIEKLAKDDLKVLAEMLGDKEFFFGSSASLLDLVVFSHLSQITVVDDSVTCTLRDHIKAEHENLFNLVDRMKTLIWGEDWVAATEQLELNPHIPKPVVEEVKEEVVEEVVEKASEEAVEKASEEATEKASEDKVEEKVEKASEEKVEEKVEDTAEAVTVDNTVLDKKFEEEVVDKVEEVSQTAETNEETEAQAE